MKVLEINSLSLENFRNYETLDISFDKRINLFQGLNGHGKTNLLEAIYICSIGKSFRTSKDFEMIKNDKEHFSVKVSISNDITESVFFTYNRDKKKAIAVNSLYLRKIGQLMGAMPSVLFCPEDLFILSEGPSLRRRFLDIAISQLSPLYYYNLSQYIKVIGQKNSQLKATESFEKIKEILPIWNQQIAEYGSNIIYERLKFVKVLKNYAKESHTFISSGKELLEIYYEDTINLKGYTEDEIKETFLMSLERVMKREHDRQLSIIGPHRDDLSFKLNNLEVRQYGSQGQKRSLILALKMAELAIIKERTGRQPILLLDDVMSELDKRRQQALMEFIKNTQTFITCANQEKSLYDLEKNIRIFNVFNGTIK